MNIVHLEAVVGSKIRDADGRIAGRLEEVHAEWRGDECIVTHYVLAPRGTYILRQLGIDKRTPSLVVPWNQMDFADPKRPRLTCRVDDLPGQET